MPKEAAFYVDLVACERVVIMKKRCFISFLLVVFIPWMAGNLFAQGALPPPGGIPFPFPTISTRRMPGWIRIVNNIEVDYGLNWLPARWAMPRNIVPFVPDFPPSANGISETAWDSSGRGNARAQLRVMRQPVVVAPRAPIPVRRRPPPPVRRFSTFRDYIRSLSKR